ncbi:hypothetical protein H1R20_g10854, partial [Candolleomyces eurysporus]
MSSLPSCSVCTNAIHPIDRPAKHIVCGHVFCSECIFQLIIEEKSCPYKCQSGARLQFRGARTLPFSIVSTSESEDYTAVLGVIQAVSLQRQNLQQLADNNSKRIKILSACITNQTSSLSRFAASTRKATANQKEALQRLGGTEGRLLQEIEREKTLLAELAAAQHRLSQVKASLSKARSSNILCGLGAAGKGIPLTPGLADAASVLCKRKRDHTSLSKHYDPRPTRRRRIA